MGLEYGKHVPNAPGEKRTTGKTFGLFAIGTFSCACVVIAPETTRGQLPPKTLALRNAEKSAEESICFAPGNKVLLTSGLMASVGSQRQTITSLSGPLSSPLPTPQFVPIQP